MPSTQSSFLMREEISSLIEKRIEALEKGYRQNIGLIGLSGSGKTRFISNIYQSIASRPPFIPIYINAACLDFSQLLDRWVGAVLSGLFLSQNVQPPQQFASLLLAADPIIPKTTEKIRHLKRFSRKERPGQLMKELFALTEALAEETSKKLILMIDEFDQLESVFSADPFGILGREIMMQKNTLFLVTSSHPGRAKEIFREKLSMLFGNFEVMEFGDLNDKETLQYIKERLNEQRLTLEQKKFLIRMTGGKPEYLDLILDQLEHCLREYAASETVLFKNLVEGMPDSCLFEVFHRELLKDKGRIAQIFQRRLDSCLHLSKDYAAYVRALIAMTRGRRKVNTIASVIDRRILETKKILSRLADENFIVRRGNFYVIEDPLFQFWLREIYDKRNAFYLPKHEILAEELFTALKREFTKSSHNHWEHLILEVELLFKEFRNDVLEIKGKKIVCPQFSEVLVKNELPSRFAIVAKSPKLRWHCQVSYEKIVEEDISSLLDELKKYRKKPERILIMLRGIEQNAKLMAQEAGIQLWDLEMLNALLDLYDFPKMIFLEDGDQYEPYVGPLAESVYQA